MKIQTIIAQCKEPFTPSTEQDYQQCQYGVRAGYLVKTPNGYLATDKGLKRLKGTVRDSVLLKQLLIDANSPEGYTATEEMGSITRYAKNCGFITPKKGSERKYYIITDKGKERLKQYE